MGAETPRAAVRAWRDRLVDLDAGNRLLNFRPSEPGTLAIAGPAAPDIVAALRGGAEYGFLPAQSPPVPGALFRTELPAATLGAQLRRLLRKSRQDYLDRGVATLHLTVGMLRWRDEEDAAFASPVLLLPAELTAAGPGDVPRLRVPDDDPVVNPALVLRLRRMGITMPPVEALAELDVRGYLARLLATVSNRGWEADESVLLSRLSFHKEAMYRDLLDNERRIVAHPLVAALAGDVGTSLPCGQLPEGVAAGVRSDRSPGGWGVGMATPQKGKIELPLVLDADATQTACVEAAVAGSSFVLDGPPGTGKSQTIANMIGCLLHAGRRVLFVSEKAAALEVVRNRLTAVGLEPYLLELHSHKTTRKEVARELAAAVEPRPPAPEPGGGHERLGELRERLDAYAAAMNERREPLGRTLHEVLGECAGAEPHAPVVELTPETLRAMVDAADDLSRCRRAATEPDFAWRGVIEQAPLTETLRRARAALQALAAETEPHREVAEAFGLTRPGDAGRLAALVMHASRRPEAVADGWLTGPSLEPVGRAAERRARRLTAARQAAAAVREAAGVDWHELPEEEPPPVEPRTLTAEGAEQEARRCAAEADTLDGLRREAGTFAELSRLAALADIAGRDNRPEPFWFGPGVLAEVSAAASVLRGCADAVAATGAECRRWFVEAIVDQPVEELAERLAHEHRGLRKLLSAYRRDWNTVAAFARPAVAPAEAVANLGAAVAWQRALRVRAAAERRYAPLLGRYRRNEAGVHEALRLAGDLVRLCPPDQLPVVADQVCRPVPDPHLVRVGAVARTVTSGQGTLLDAAAERRARAGKLTEVAAALRAYERVVGRQVDLAEAVRLARLRRRAAEEERALAADRETTLTLSAGGAEEGLDDAIAWATAARRLVGGVDRPLTGEQAAALRPADAHQLLERAGAWEDARDSVLAAFAPARRDELAAALDDYAGAVPAALLDDADGQDEWLGYDRARRVLGEAVTEFCVEHELTGPALERALLAAWAGAVIRDDERLHPAGGPERDRLVEEFRRLDAACAGQAPAAIAAAVEQRRAADSVPDEVAMLRREGMKETRHPAVRDLIGQARRTVQASKPCFLMSPLAVSQFLPSDLTFDVVIFDEASQLAPADAVNCVYRADALIVAGDERQLPPTAFFAAHRPEEGSDVNDFQSVLELAKGCGAFPVLGLGWHYRSRHEALIAFSNHRFYSGRLTTFPGANADPETGVELVPARGVYRRGTTRDNPVEAEVAAQRIVACLTTRPELSLGVVTFSVAQAEAIEAALDHAASRHPGLDRLLGGDRLSGFFVKSLESVQGDERDVMIFSIGYGPDEHGRVSANFGALNQPDGWRRLNVAITRARRRVEIVSSVRARDIPDSANRGVRHLAAYLDYAERGAASLPGQASGTADPFARSVLETVRDWGYDAHAGIGLDGYRIDVGVRGGTPGGGYVLGIECDGPLYGSIAAARDRDRLSAEVLTGLGWRLHRIWGVAWHRDRAAEEARLRHAIEQAVGPLPAAGPRPYRRVDFGALRPVS
ncbi:DUF4011 domain-containing protein [Actinoplanes sp. URMC 104]|uniref:DUF4011 domain-containing protein n=1 Tax=Actinoplanes sp. URMC 104 TaxID=3423409 RepID=UPI003F1B5897